MPEYFDCDQNSEDWFRCRMGIPTASKFAIVLAKGKGGGQSLTRAKYMRELAAEIVTGEPTESYSNGYMERGHEQEGEARTLYAMLHDVDPNQVGFIREGQKGCSPDSLINDDGLLEIKTKRADILIECMFRDGPPPEHNAQIQGQLWISGREWLDLFLYCPKFTPVVHRVTPDKPFIETLSSEIDRFNDELAEMVERIRNYGAAE